VNYTLLASTHSFEQQMVLQDGTLACGRVDSPRFQVFHTRSLHRFATLPYRRAGDDGIISALTHRPSLQRIAVLGMLTLVFRVPKF
jgi:hypothetical protein